MQDTSVNIRIGGEAGQGLDTVGQLLTRALIRSGYEVVVVQSYLSRIRGGHNTFTIRTGPDPIQAPGSGVDVLIALNQETVDKHKEVLKEGAVVIMDQELDDKGVQALKVPYEDLVEKKIHTNTAALGVAAGLLGLSQEVVAELINEQFGAKKPEVAEANTEVLSKAYAWLERQDTKRDPLPETEDKGQRLMLAGSEAVALGAMASGVTFCSFYPMTPSTGVALNLISNARELGIVVEQAEDEIAAINMAIGASFAGARALVPTSGGGFALMTEGVSLAGMTETPVVVVVAQRPGPATGLPTRTEQADLDLVLNAGHGEFPRAVFAPGTPEECFFLTRKAFDLAERFQGPMFVLSDQYLADSYRAVQPFDLEGMEDIAGPGTETDNPEEYQRYALTENGVSPRLVPGFGSYLVVADSDEHTPDGHITEDHDVRVSMVDKRLTKGLGLFEEVIAPELDGDAQDALLLVCWGSSKGSVQEAAARLREQGKNVAMLHFSQVWPLKKEQFLSSLEQAATVVSVESNALGQLARLIRRETGFHIPKLLTRFDGLPITPEHILERLDRIA